MEGASGSSRAPARLAELHEAAAGAGVAKGNHLAESGWSPAVAQTVAGTARSVLVAGREGGARLWATGSQLSPQGRRAAGEAGEYGFRGTAPQDCGSQKGRLRGSERLAQHPRRAGRGAERTAPREWEASRRRGKAGKLGTRSGPWSRRPPEQKPETALLLGRQDRPEGSGRLKCEPREQLRARGGGGGGRRSKLLQAVVNPGLARPFLALEEGAAPEGYSSGSRSESEGGGRGSGGPRGVFVLGGEGAV